MPYLAKNAGTYVYHPPLIIKYAVLQLMHCSYVHIYIHSNNNIVMGETTDVTIPVQTPAVDFTLTNDSVSKISHIVIILVYVTVSAKTCLVCTKI